MNENPLLDRIDVNPEVLVGKPIIRGTRISVEFVLGLLEGGWSFEDILTSYAGVTADDVRACIAYARDVLEEVKVYSVRG